MGCLAKTAVLLSKWEEDNKPRRYQSVSGTKDDAAAGWIFHSDFLQPPQSWNQLNAAVLLSFYFLQLSAELHLTNLHVFPLEGLQMLTKVMEVYIKPGTDQLIFEACFKYVFLVFNGVTLVLRNCTSLLSTSHGHCSD